MKDIEFKFNPIAFQNSVAHWQERQQGDNHTIIIAAIDRKTRVVNEAKYGQFKGQKIQLVTIRPLVSAGYDRFHQRPFFSISATYQPALAANEWMGVSWLDDIERRTKGCLGGEDIPYPVRCFLLEGNNADARFASTPVYRWLSQLFGAVSQKPGDAAAKESARLARIADGLVPPMVAPGGLILGGLPTQVEMGVAA